MAILSRDIDGLFVVRDCYDYREAIANIGGKWDAQNRCWSVIPSIYNLNYLLENVGNLECSAGTEDYAKALQEKETKLQKISDMSKSDDLVNFTIPGLKLPPHNYQKLGVMFALTANSGVLIADEMGLGKSLQGIATAVYLKSLGKAKKVLVVVPASLKYNWPMEIEKFTNEKYVVIDGTPEERIKQWLRDDVFFYVVNYELVIEDLFGGRVLTPKEDETEAQRVKRESRIAKVKGRSQALQHIKGRIWDCLIVDECFPYNTPIMTSAGWLPIGYIVENRLSVSVLSCNFSNNEPSWGQITRWIGNPLSRRGRLLKISHEFGELICTEHHKIWTEEYGYIKASELSVAPGSRLRILRESVFAQEQTSEVLHSEMQRSVEVPERKRMERESDSISASRSDISNREETSRRIAPHDSNESASRISTKGYGRKPRMEKDSSNISSAGRQTPNNKTSAAIVSSIRIGLGVGAGRVGSKENVGSDRQSSALLSDRHCESETQNSCGGRRTVPSNEQMENHRWSQGQGFISSRMVGVEILEPRDYGKYGISLDRNTRVYNLEVQEHHNYIANGVLVANCHYIKHATSRRSQVLKDLKAKIRIALTGTPVDGKLEELHSLMNFVMPGLLGSKTRFFQRYVKQDFWGKVTGYMRISEVTERIKPFFIRRLKKDVLKDLPDKIYMNIPVLLTPAESKIYKALAECGHEATEDAQAMVAVIRCKQFCNYPPMVDPNCSDASKLDALRNVLDEVVTQNGHKVLIFSQYKEMVNIIVEVLNDLHMKYLRIDGDTDKQVRADMQKQFEDDKTLDVMIGTEAMSLGLNFTIADYVINFDDNWSPAIMSQREDRAHRLGQKRVVTVVSFVCKDTIEERIRSVIYDKSKISASVMGDNTDEAVLQRMNPKEVAKLL